MLFVYRRLQNISIRWTNVYKKIKTFFQTVITEKCNIGIAGVNQIIDGLAYKKNVFSMNAALD